MSFCFGCRTMDRVCPFMRATMWSRGLDFRIPNSGCAVCMERVSKCFLKMRTAFG